MVRTTGFGARPRGETWLLFSPDGVTWLVSALVSAFVKWESGKFTVRALLLFFFTC